MTDTTIVDEGHDKQDIEDKDTADLDSVTFARKTTFGGLPCVYNLNWQPIERKKLSEYFSSSDDHKCELLWDDRIAYAYGLEFDGYPALLSLIVSNLSHGEVAGPVLIGYSIPDESLWFSAILFDGKPVLGEERVFDSEQALCDHLKKMTDTTTVIRLFVSAELIKKIDVSKPVLAISDSQLDIRDYDLFNLIRTPLIIRILRILIPVCIVLGALLGAIMYFFPELLKKAEEEVVVQVVQKFPHIENFKQFRQGCENALETPWPVVLGWELSTEGCATRTMNDPELVGILDSSAAAYQIHTFKPNYNDILSRRAAESILSKYPHKYVMEQGRFIMLKPFDVGYILFEKTAGNSSAEQSVPFVDNVEDAFVGIATGLNFTPKGASVLTSAPLSEVFRRFNRMKGVSLQRLVRNGKQTNIELTEQRPVFLTLEAAKNL